MTMKPDLIDRIVSQNIMDVMDELKMIKPMMTGIARKSYNFMMVSLIWQCFSDKTNATGYCKGYQDKDQR